MAHFVRSGSRQSSRTFTAAMLKLPQVSCSRTSTVRPQGTSHKSPLNSVELEGTRALPVNSLKDLYLDPPS